MTEISKKLGIYHNTIYHISDTLRHWEYVEQDPHNQKYQLGMKLIELGMAKLHPIDLAREATPYIKELVN